MDLPVSNKSRTVHSSRESLNSSDEVGDKTPNEGKTEDMTTAERFATQNQCTLKKNERFCGPIVAATENGCNRSRETKVTVDAKALSVALNGTQEKLKADGKTLANFERFLI